VVVTPAVIIARARMAVIVVPAVVSVRAVRVIPATVAVILRYHYDTRRDINAGARMIRSVIALPAIIAVAVTVIIALRGGFRKDPEAAHRDQNSDNQ